MRKAPTNVPTNRFAPNFLENLHSDSAETTPAFDLDPTLLAAVKSSLPWLDDGGAAFMVAAELSKWEGVSFGVARLSVLDIEAQKTVSEFLHRVCARFLTLSSFRPLDLDGTLLETLSRVDSRTLGLQLASCLHSALSWDPKPYSRRWLPEIEPEDRLTSASRYSTILSEHQGEAMAWGVYVYRALKRFAPHLAPRVALVLEHEVERELMAFEAWLRKGASKELVTAAWIVEANLKAFEHALIETQLADSGDPLQSLFRLGVLPHTALDQRVRRLRRVVQATASGENWRSFSLKIPSSVMKDSKLLLPRTPFLEGWGTSVATSRVLSRSEKIQVLEFLIQTCHAQPQSMVWPRAVHGLVHGLQCANGEANWMTELSADAVKKLTSGLVSKWVGVSPERFAATLSQAAVFAASPS
jgi:hypothetical protein